MGTEAVENGFQYLQISPEQYHQRSEINHGLIRCYASEGPLVCHAKYIENSIPRNDSDALRFGRAFHMAMAEPGAWQDYYQIIPTTFTDGSDINRRLKAHREWLAELEQRAAAAGKDFISDAEATDIEAMVDSVWANPAAARYCQAATRQNVERAAIRRDTETDLWLRALADLDLSEQLDTIVDFKSTRHCRPADFIRDAYRNGYHYQAAHYLRVFGARHFILVGVHKQSPFEAMVYRVPDLVIDQATTRNQLVLRRIQDSLAMDSWHNLGWGEELALSLEEQ